MMNGSNGISVADALALRNSGFSDGAGGFGGDSGAWWVIILILFFSIGGWGRGGLGGNEGGGGFGFNGCCTPATMQGMSDAFNFNQLDNGIRGIQQGLCDGFYAMNNSINGVLSAIQNCCCQTQLGMCQGFNGVQQGIANLGFQTQQGFCGVDKAIMQSDFHSQAGFNSIANQLASCCCDLRQGQENIKYALATDTNAIISANEKNTDRIINYLTQTEMDKLRTELQSAQFQLSQLSQTRTLIDQLMPVAKPAYLTCSPYASSLGLGGYTIPTSGCNSCC